MILRFVTFKTGMGRHNTCSQLNLITHRGNQRIAKHEYGFSHVCQGCFYSIRKSPESFEFGIINLDDSQIVFLIHQNGLSGILHKILALHEFQNNRACVVRHMVVRHHITLVECPTCSRPLRRLASRTRVILTIREHCYTKQDAS